MPTFTRALIVLTCGVFAFSPIARSQDKSSTPLLAAEWTRVDAAMEDVKRAMRGPAETLRTVYASYEKLAAEFLAKHPGDAKRWNMRFFEAVTLEARRNAGLNVQGDQLAIINEILTAPDVDDETRSGASAVRVLAVHRTLEQAGHYDSWIKIAEEHLKTFPVHLANLRIKACLEQVKLLLAYRDKTPDLKFVSIDGRHVDLAALKGKVVLVEFWESGCDRCMAELPTIKEAFDKLHPAGFEVIGICLDRDEMTVKQFVEANQMTWPQHHDGRAWEGALVTRLGVHYVPTLWLVDKAGRLVCTDARGRLEARVRKLLDEKSAP